MSGGYRPGFCIHRSFVSFSRYYGNKHDCGHSHLHLVPCCSAMHEILAVAHKRRLRYAQPSHTHTQRHNHRVPPPPPIDYFEPVHRPGRACPFPSLLHLACVYFAVAAAAAAAAAGAAAAASGVCTQLLHEPEGGVSGKPGHCLAQCRPQLRQAADALRRHRHLRLRQRPRHPAAAGSGKQQRRDNSLSESAAINWRALKGKHRRSEAVALR